MFDTGFEKRFQKSLFLPALAFAVFATAVIDVILPLLLTDIAKTFAVPVGTASTISSFSAIVGVVVGLLLAVLSIHFKQKTLLLVGVFCINLAAIGSYLAPSLSVMQIFYSLNGVGSVMVAAMAYSLIGDLYALDKRGKAVGWIVAAGFLAFTVGAPLTGVIANVGGWRSVMLWFVLPVSSISLLFALFVLPSKLNQSKPAVKAPILAGCRQTLSNKSAVACLIGSMLIAASGAITTFVISFWRYEFAITTTTGAIITMVNASSAAIGGIIAGRLINRAGRKPLGVVAGLVSSVLIGFTVFMPSLSLSWGVSIARVWCYGMLGTALASLTLEQLPKFRSTIMSLRGAFLGVGSFIGVTAGGLALNTFSYQAVGLVLGTLGIAAVIVILFLTKDPCKT